MKKKHLKKNKPLFMAAVVAAAYIAANYMPSLAATYNVTDFSGDDGLKNAFGNGEYFDGTDTQNLTSGDTVLFGGNITGSETLTQKVSGIILDGGGNTYSADAGSDTGIIIGTGSTLTVKDLTVSGFANAIQNAGTLNFTGNDSITGNLDNSSTVNNSGTLTLNGNNATLGLTGKNTGSVTLNAQNGKLSLSKVTLSGSDIIASAVQTTVDTDGIVIGGGSDVSLTGGDDSWTGDVTLSGGSLTVGNYNNTNTRSGALIAESGNLTIDSNGLTLDKAGDGVDYSVNTVINGNLTINNASASVNLDGSDKIDSTVTLTSGSLNLDGVDTTNQGGNIVANGGKVTIENNSVTLGKTGDSIGAGTELAVNENLSVSGGTVELNSNDTIAAGKKITLNSGKLSSDNFSTTAAGGSLDVQKGELEIKSGGLTLNNANDMIAENASVEMNGDLNINAGEVHLDSSDTLTSGTINLGSSSTGELSLNGVTTGGVKINAQGGSVSLTDTVLKGGDVLGSDADVSLAGTTTITDAIVNLDSNDTWNSATTLNGGTLNLNGVVQGADSSIKAETGELNLDGQTLSITSNSSVADAVKTTIDGGSTLEVSGGSVVLNGALGADVLTNGTVKLTEGSLTLNNVTTSDDFSVSASDGSLQLSGVVLNNESDIISDIADVTITNGITVNKGSITLDINNNNDSVSGGITQTGGTVGVSNISTSSGNAINSTGGNLTLSNASLNGGDTISSAAALSLKGTTTITDATVNLDSNESWGDAINLQGGTLNLNSATQGNSKLNATGGTLNSTSTDITIGADQEIAEDVTFNMDGGTLKVDGGKVALNGAGQNKDTLTSGILDLDSGELSLSDISTSANLSIDADGGKITLNNINLNNADDSIIAAVETTVNGNVAVNNGVLELNSGDTLTKGTVSLDSSSTGTLSLSGIETGSVNVNAQGGTVKLDNATLSNANDDIGSGAKVEITNGAEIQNGSLALESDDSISGTVSQTGGKLEVSGITTDSTKNINSTGGTVTLSDMTLGGGDMISAATKTTLSGTTTVTDATLNLDANESWGDKINLEGGTLNLNSATQGNSKLNATGGTLNSNNTALTIGTGSQIAENVNAVLNGGSLTITADGNVELAGTNDTWNTKTTLNGGTLTLKGVEQGTSAALNALSGVLNIEEGQEVTIAGGNAVAEAVQTTIKGDSNLIVDGGTVVLNGTGTGADTLESGKVTLESGTLTLKDVETSTDFYVDSNGGSLTLNNVVLNNANDNVDKNSIVKVEGPLKITDGEVNLNTGDTWTGDITLLGGSLNYEGLKTNGKLVADGGNLSITGGESNTTLNIADGSSIAKAVQVEIDGNVKINGKTASVILDGDTDTLTSGSIQLTDGYLEMNDLNTTKVSIQATGGDLTLNNVGLDNDRDDIKFGVHTTINGPVNITKGNVELDAEDTLNSNETITLNGENATLGVDGFATDTTNLSLQKGTLHIVNRGLTLNNASDLIQKEIKTIVDGNLTINQGTTYLNEGDEWNAGVITVNSDGKLQFENFKASSSNVLVMDGDAKTELLNSSVAIAQAENIKNGTMTVDNGSIISIGSGEYNLADMNTSGGIYTINGAYQTHNAQTMTILNSDYTTLDNNVVQTDGQANFGIDLFARLRETNQNSDVFKGTDLTLSDTSSEGTVNISDWTLNGHLTRKDAPIDRYYNFKLFDYENIDSNIKFTATDKETFTPIGYYRLFGGKDGNYTLALTRYNPQVFRAQVTTLAQYNNILSTQDIVTNHVILHNERKLADMGQNRYAAATPTLGPYLYTQEDGGLWMKGYGDIEKLSMSQGLNVNNVSYGSIIGADFPLVNLKNGWKFIPTPFVGYNGAHQSFNGVSAYQNGGQAGFMGTFMKNNYISSHTIYGGGYYNEMHVDYVKDDTASWFWGTAHRFAYNWNIKRHVILQPTAFLSYNMLGKQNFHSEFGDMGMRAGMLNGINIAPGLNLIYMKDDWSLYGGVQYMWNINEQVSGRAGNVYIPNMNMRHGFIQYGIGGTKNIKDDLAAYGQVMFRNGGRTGVAFQVGLQYYFDIREIGSKIKSAFTRNPKVSNK